MANIQTQRKESGFEVTDRIKVFYDASEKLTQVISNNKDAIASDVLAIELTKDASEEGKEWDINGESVTIGVEKL